MKRILSVFLGVLLMLSLCSGFTVNANAQTPTPQTYYEYPTVPGTAEWGEFETHAEMVAAVQVPDDLLKKMTTEELVVTVLENPLAPLIFAYHTYESGYGDGYKILCNDLNCFRELDNRVDASDKLSKVIRDWRSSVENLEDYDNPVNFKRWIGETILGCVQSTSSLFLSSSKPELDSQVTASTTTVYTPNNTAVTVYSSLTWADHGMTAAQAQTETNYIMSVYPNAVKIANQSPVYNCHNYAWNTGSPSSYWMNYPSAYMTDGSYTNTGNALAGYRVHYSTGDHSAIILSNYDDNIYVKSKWGALPAFEHNVHYCPYASTSITFWKR
jgi:hypothetical protein